MHFVCSPFGSSGDVHPMLGLALALKARGHRITVICSGYFENLVRGRGLDFVQLGTRDEFLALVNRDELWKPLKAFQFLYREGVAPTMRRHYELLAEYQREGPLVAISNLFGFGARVAQERLNVPLVTLHLQPSVMWSDIDPPRLAGLVGPRWLKSRMYDFGERCVIDRAVCPSLNGWRAECGLPPIHRVTRWWHSPWCVACAFPTWYAPPPPDWPANRIQTSFPLWDEPSDAPLAGELESFLAAGDRPLAFTPGSANVFGREFFAAACDACRRLGRRGLLLTRFAEQLPAALPEWVMHVNYAPFSQLLPRCAAFVHHGGIGSMSQAMAAGIPQLIVPLAHDQFDNAYRVHRLGVGASLGHHRVSGRRMAVALARIMDSTTTAESCRQIACRVAESDGAAEMAEAIERRVDPAVANFSS